jgi:hypothetical protein
VSDAPKKINRILLHTLLMVTFLGACSPAALITSTPVDTDEFAATPTLDVTSTPLPVREVYAPGTLVDYIAQDGDSLISVAAHFNTTEDEIRFVNPDIPANATTLPAGYPMQIPIYYKALWGSPFKILPNAYFVDGPKQIGFDTAAFVDAQPGWLKDYSAQANGVMRRGGDLVEYVAWQFSVSPRLLLAIAEYQAGALSSPTLDDGMQEYPLGFEDNTHKGFYLQLILLADQLNTGYYMWQTGRFDSLVLMDGTMENPDPWQNAATVGIQSYFARVMGSADYKLATSTEGLSKTYITYFDDPWLDGEANIPGSLTQPELRLPFEDGKTWAYTGGPHASWGNLEPLGALDFAPPSVVGKCSASEDFVVAIADGEVSRTDTGVVMLDLDADGDDRTGWVIFYLHIGSTNKTRQGVLVTSGTPIGYPSCEGGSSTGTHVHIARKYNGEWIAADGAIPFVIDGWKPHNGSAPYKGTLTRMGYTITASDVASYISLITAGK